MPTPTYTLIDSVTLTSSAASVTFSSIDQSFGDLVIHADVIGTGGGWYLLRFNGDTGSNYSRVSAGSSGSASNSGSASGTSIDIGYQGGFSATTRAPMSASVFDYSATDKHKSVLLRQDNASSAAEMAAGRWANTAAISSLTLTTATQQFASTSTFFLYGIAKAL
tara:strand:- start:225 stop:719 length:495 start_codon:yes stop_codon:yes gene_type:complete